MSKSTVRGGEVVSGHTGSQDVYSGGTAIGTLVSGGRKSSISPYSDYQQTVHSGGAAYGTVLSGCSVEAWQDEGYADIDMDFYGSQLVQSGGLASGTSICGMGRQTVEAGGTALDAAVLGGYLGIESKGFLSGATIFSGSLDIQAGGTAFGIVQKAGGYVYVAAASGTVVSGVNASGDAFRLSGGKASNFILYSRQRLSLHDGCMAFGTVVSSGGSLQLESGGTALNTTVCSGGSQIGYASYSSAVVGTVFNTVVSSGGMLLGGLVEEATILSGGTALSAVQQTHGNVNATVYGGDMQTLVSGRNASGGRFRLSGGTASGFILHALGWQRISSGGSAVGTTLDGGSQSIHAGGFASGTVVSSCAIQEVLADGTAVGTMLDGGRQIVSAGAFASSTFVSNGGTQDVLAGGAAASTVVYAGGTQHVFSGGSVWHATAFSGGVQIVDAGGMLLNPTVFSGGSQIISSGGEASGGAVVSSGSQTVSAGGLASGVKVLSGGVQIILSGGIAFSSILEGVQTVQTGGLAFYASVLSGGVQTVFGGAASGTKVYAGAVQRIASGGRAFKTAVGKGGLLTVSSGGSALAARIGSGASFAVRSGGAVSALTVLSGGSASICGGTLGGRTVFSDASLTVSSTGTKFRTAAADASSFLSFSVKNAPAGASKAMLTAASAQTLSCRLGIDVAALQNAGSYWLMKNVSLKEGTSFAVSFNGKSAGSAAVNAAPLEHNGMLWKAAASNGKVKLSVSAKAGRMKHGGAANDKLAGTSACDVFWGGKENDRINGSGGRDVAVYGTGKWGQDVVTETSGTMTLLFHVLKAQDVVSSLSGTTMTITKKADASQKITVSGWNDATHSLLFSPTMSAFKTWANAAAPTTAQAKAARQDVWKAAGLLAAG